MSKSSNIYFPSNELEKTFINSIWSLSDNDIHQRKEVILPKGTVEIIFNFSDAIEYSNSFSLSSQKLPSVFINGINFKPFELLKTGRQQFLGIQINSIGLRILFNISPKEINDLVCDGAEICKQLNNLANELFQNQKFEQQVITILSWIRNKISHNSSQYPLARARQLMNCRSYENLSVKKLCDEICLSDRQLRRFSNDWLGMNTEEFIHYSKYLNSLQLLHYSNTNLSEIGLQVGYYDQSHFIHEFKSYTRMTPREYREANKEYLGHIFLNS
ncbi:MAG: AraC family transcriptional regulator [Chitinophagales bacterium]|nr:AraC family transcriptional regulator [Chitinophagales bacterium]